MKSWCLLTEVFLAPGTWCPLCIHKWTLSSCPSISFSCPVLNSNMKKIRSSDRQIFSIERKIVSIGLNAKGPRHITSTGDVPCISTHVWILTHWRHFGVTALPHKFNRKAVWEKRKKREQLSAETTWREKKIIGEEFAGQQDLMQRLTADYAFELKTEETGVRLIDNWLAWKIHVGKGEFTWSWQIKRKYEARNWLSKKIQLFGN